MTPNPSIERTCPGKLSHASHLTSSMRPQKVRITVAVLLVLVCLVGCSKPVEPDDARLIQSAIQYSYPSIYSDLPDLRMDYPGFTPRIRRWSDDSVFLFGEGLYAVRMPEEEVLVTADGKAKTTRGCGSVEADCTRVVPQNPELGIVGTVQLGGPDYPVAQGLEVSWKGSPGPVYVVGHCFAAFKSSAEPLELSLNVPGYKPIEISGVYGARLIAANFDSKFNYYASMRIPRTTFLDSKTCSEDARANWPNVGGFAWKR